MKEQKKDDLMSRTIVENLSIGIDPLSGKALPSDHICNNEIVQQALLTVLENCSLESYGTAQKRKLQEKSEAKAKQKQSSAAFSPKPKTIPPVKNAVAKKRHVWTPSEDAVLTRLVAKGHPVKTIAAIIGLPQSEITARIQEKDLQ